MIEFNLVLILSPSTPISIKNIGVLGDIGKGGCSTLEVEQRLAFQDLGRRHQHNFYMIVSVLQVECRACVVQR